MRNNTINRTAYRRDDYREYHQINPADVVMPRSLRELKEIMQETAERLKTENVPVWKKYALSIKDASDYFSIGETKLREILRDNPDAPYALHNGSRALIKREAFEEFLDRYNDI